MSKETKVWDLSQLETSADEGQWIDVLPGVPTLRYVRVKPDEWAKWTRQMFDGNSEVVGHIITLA